MAAPRSQPSLPPCRALPGLLPALLLALAPAGLPGQQPADSVARDSAGAGPAVAPPADTVSVTADSAALRSFVDSLAVALLDGGPAAGMSVAVVHGPDTLVWEGYGEADLELDVPATPETVYRIASVTKQFTAAAVLRQVEAGRIALDDTVHAYLPELPFAGSGITIRHLLSHTAGIPRYAEVDGLIEAIHRDPGHEAFLASMASASLDFPPGTDWRYTNSAYYVLGMVLEEVTGEPYDRHVAEQLAAPLGLRDTRYCWTTPLIEDRAEGYAVEDGELVNEDPLEMALPYAAGALCSTVGDLVAWTRALFSGEVVGREGLERMTTPLTLPDTVETGYGFGVRVDSLEGQRVFFHSGGINGFASHLSHYPETDLTIAVLINTRGAGASGVQERIARRAMGLPQPGMLARGLSEVEARRYTGKFMMTGLQLPIEIVLEEGELVARPAGQAPFRLVYRGEHEFRAEANPEIRLVFEMRRGRAASFTLHHEDRSFEVVRVEREGG